MHALGNSQVYKIASHTFHTKEKLDSISNEGADDTTSPEAEHHQDLNGEKEINSFEMKLVSWSLQR